MLYTYLNALCSDSHVTVSGTVFPLYLPGVVKLKLSESLVPNVSLTVMVAVCSPGAKSNTLMLSTSGPAGRKWIRFLLCCSNYTHSNVQVLRIQLVPHSRLQNTYTAPWIHHQLSTGLCPVDHHQG